MSAAGPTDPDPIANTEMFRRFVDDEPRPADPVVTRRSPMLTVGLPVLALVLVVAVVLLLVL